MADEVMSGEDFLALPDEGEPPALEAGTMSGEDFLALPDEGEPPITPMTGVTAGQSTTAMDPTLMGPPTVAPRDLSYLTPGGGAYTSLAKDPEGLKETAIATAKDPRTWGAAIGSMLLSPLGPWAARAGGITGAGGAEVVGQYLEATPEEPFDPMGKIGRDKVAWETGKEALLSFLMPGGTTAVKVGRKAGAPLVHKLDAAQKAAWKQAEEAGIRQSVSEITKSRGAAAMERFVERWPWLTKPAREFIEAQKGDVQNAVEWRLKQLDPNYAQAELEGGKLALASSKTRLEKYEDISHKLFEAPKQFFKPTDMFDTAPVYHEVQNVLGEIANKQWVKGKLAGTVAGRARLPNQPLVMASELKGKAAKFIEKNHLDELDATQMNYDRLRAIQSEAGELGRKLKGTLDGRYMAMIQKAISQSVDDIGKIHPGVTRLLEKAKNFEKNVIIKNFRDSPEYQKLKGLDASLVADRIFDPNMSVEAVKRLRRTMPTEAFRKLVAGKFYSLSGLQNKVVDKTFGMGEELSKNMAQYSPEVLEEMLGKKEYREIKKILDTLQSNKEMRGGRPGDLATAGSTTLQLKDIAKVGVGAAGATGTALGLGANLPVAGFIAGVSVLSPKVATWMLYSPKGRRWLTEGLLPKNQALRKGGKLAVHGLGELPKAYVRENIIGDEQTQRETFQRFIGDWPLTMDEEDGGEPLPDTVDIPDEQAPPAIIFTPMQKAFGAGR